MFRVLGILFVLIFFFSCKDEAPIKQLYTYPESNLISQFKNKEGQPELYISLVGDLSQQIYPQTELRSVDSPTMMPATLKVGGLSYLSSYLKTLREKVEKESNTEYLSLAMGSTLSTKELDPSRQKIIQTSLPQLNFDLIQMGLQESLWAKEHSQKKKGSTNWINSNIFSIQTGKPLEYANSLPYWIKSVGSTFIGIMAISSFQSVNEEQKKEISGIYFQDPLTAILRTRNILKSKNVHLNILLYQGELSCPEIIYDGAISFEKLEDQTCLEKKDLELFQLLSKLPPNTIDLIVSTSLNLSAGIIANTPILGLPDSKYFVSLAKLVIDDQKHVINKKESYLLPPLKLCHQVFAGLEDCVLNAQNSSVNDKRFEYLENTAFGLIPPKFLGNQISTDSKIESYLNDK